MKQRSYPSLAVQMEGFVKETDKRLEAVLKASLQDVLFEATLPKARGGRLPVHTGFLRSSLLGKKGSMPAGEGTREQDERFFYDDGNKPLDTSVTRTIASLKVGDTVYFGWVAEYAPVQELRNGFLEGALQNWGRIVAFNTDTLRRKLKNV